MSGRKADLSKLDDAISSLSDDAEGMHSLITRSTDELERATAVGTRTADIAEEALRALAPLTDELRSSISDAKRLITDTREAVDGLSDDLSNAQEAGKEEFDAFKSASLRASEKTRDDLQTDLLSHKNAISARMDSLEAMTSRRVADLEAKVANLAEVLYWSVEESLGKKTELLQKKISLPLYGVIAVAVLQLITLAALLLR